MTKSSSPKLTDLDQAERFRLLINSISDYAIYMLDPTAWSSSWNTGAQRFKGYTADEIIGQHFSALLHRGGPRRRACRRERWRPPAGRAGSSAKAGACARTARVLGPCRDRSDPRRDGAGCIGFAKITRDLTERRAAEDAAARRASSSSALLVQGVTDYAIYMLDPEGLVRAGTLGARAHQGLRGRRDRRPALLALLHRGGPRRRRAGNERWRPRSARAASRSEGWRVRKDGDAVLGQRGDRSASATTTAALLGFAKITRDITERRTRSERWSRRARRCSSRRRWRRSASSPAAWRTTSTIC